MNNTRSQDGFMLKQHHFSEIVALHDEWRPRLTEARLLLTTHAAELAQLVMSLPGTDTWSEAFVRDHILHWRKKIERVSGESVFEPWTDRWNGVWSNGSPQYHIWDKTRRWGEEWVQVVAQSEYIFPDEPALRDLIQAHKTDLGINVYSEEFGVTGWVSKRQHGQLEIPCLGYVLDASSLLWICMLGDAPKLDSGQWFVYLETVEHSAESRHYVINGHPFTIAQRVHWDEKSRNEHTGRYTVASYTK